MKKIIFAALTVVILVLIGCSQSKLMFTDEKNFLRPDSGLYTPSGEMLINLTWLNDTGKSNAAVILVKTAITNEEDFSAYVMGEEEEILDFFDNVGEILEWYKDNKYSGGGFELYGKRWEIDDLNIEESSVEIESVDYYYTFEYTGKVAVAQMKDAVTGRTGYVAAYTITRTPTRVDK